VGWVCPIRIDGSNLVAGRPEFNPLSLARSCAANFGFHDGDGPSGVFQCDRFRHFVPSDAFQKIVDLVIVPAAVQELQRTRTILMQAGQSQKAQEVDAAMQALQRGGDAEKTLIGTMLNLDQGKRQQ